MLTKNIALQIDKLAFGSTFFNHEIHEKTLKYFFRVISCVSWFILKLINIKLLIFSISFTCFLCLSNCLSAESKKISAYKIGDKREFWTWELKVMPPEDVKMQATCRGIGENVYVFVSDDVWKINIFQEDIEKIIDVFDHATPETSIDKDKGIYDIVTETFGNPPDVDNDPRIYFLISQLGGYHGHNFDGFFRAIDETKGNHSNHIEILYLDCDNPSDDYYLAIIAHEFQHMIHWLYDHNEAGWIGESLSEAAMILCGYYTDKRHVARYLNNTNSPLISNRHMKSYGACLLWGTYVYERFGREFLKELVLEEANGIEGFQKAITNTNREDDFSDIFGDWLVTNYLNASLSVNKNYKYKSITLPTSPTVKHFFSLPVYDSANVYGYAANYLKFSIKRAKDKKLRITFKSDSNKDFLIKIIKIDNDDLSNSLIEDIKLNKPVEVFDVTGIGTNYREVVLAVSVMKITKEPVSYTFSASLIPSVETELH